MPENESNAPAEDDALFKTVCYEVSEVLVDILSRQKPGWKLAGIECSFKYKSSDKPRLHLTIVPVYVSDFTELGSDTADVGAVKLTLGEDIPLPNDKARAYYVPGIFGASRELRPVPPEDFGEGRPPLYRRIEFFAWKGGREQEFTFFSTQALQMITGSFYTPAGFGKPIYLSGAYVKFGGATGSGDNPRPRIDGGKKYFKLKLARDDDYQGVPMLPTAVPGIADGFPCPPQWPPKELFLLTAFGERSRGGPNLFARAAEEFDGTYKARYSG